jgi:hypothetical protein
MPWLQTTHTNEGLRRAPNWRTMSVITRNWERYDSTWTQEIPGRIVQKGGIEVNRRVEKAEIKQGRKIHLVIDKLCQTKKCGRALVNDT